MLLPFDRQLFRFLRNDITSYQLAAWLVPIALSIGALIWVWLERRSRVRWQATSVAKTFDSSEGPYRASRHLAFRERAPRLVRVVSWLGITVGMLGLIWPVLFVSDLAGGPSTFFS